MNKEKLRKIKKTLERSESSEPVSYATLFDIIYLIEALLEDNENSV